MKDFYTLTLPGRARRLRTMALAALEHYDLDVTGLRLITNQYNAIYRADTPDGPLVVRILRPGERTNEEIGIQAAWTAALAQEGGVNVPRPLPNRSGDLVTLISVPGVPEERQCMVCTWIPGKPLGEQLTLENVAKQGALMAQMHAHAQHYTPPNGAQIKVFDRLNPYPEPSVLLDSTYTHRLEEADREAVRFGLELVQAELGDLLASEQSMFLLHGDLHQWNVHFSRGTVYALDFDDMLCGYAVQDIGITLYYYHRHDDWDAKLAAFRRGYESVLAWPERHPAEVDTWILSRGLNLMDYVLWRHDDDPAEAEWLPFCVEGVLHALERMEQHRQPALVPLASQ